MPGSFNPSQPSNRPGLYVRFVTKANDALQTQEGDTVALPIRAQWGPVGVVTSITSERVLNNVFGQQRTGWLVADALRGGAGEVLAYRMADNTAAKAAGAAAASGAASGIALTAIYEGTLGNAIQPQVSEYLPDPTKDIFRLLASGVELEKFVYANADVSGLVARLNSESAYVTATSFAVASTVLAHTTGAALAGGNDGAATLQTYTDALEAFQGAGDFEVISVDSVATAVKEEFIDWVREQNEAGNYLHGVFGAPVGSVAAVALIDALDWSQRAQNEHLVNVGGVNVVDRSGPDPARGATQIYSGAEKAAFVAGLIANARISRGITYRSLGAETDVHLPLDDGELQAAQDGGVLTFAKRQGVAKVESAVTTFTDYTPEKDSTFSQIRAVRVMEQIGRDFEAIVGDGFIGVKNNTAETRNALLKAIDGYLEQLAAVGAILPGYIVELDPTQDSVSGQSIFIQVQLQFGPELLRVFLTLTAPTRIV